ncbi:MAG TPA: OsmC family protein [Kouleothrix sp.]|uniref:OsmC family protein n=1 Tax=Kouleothrix sp. TaxID=2779161 RepID=UPI002CA06964|nr:OsmC family protein [Kouleothrix sp.]HRC75730.1 OsmC family protein [Kouleothrix sp.]
MAQIELTWVEKQRFLGVDSAGHSVVLSPPTDVGVKPSETLLIALAACAAHDVVEILHKQRAGLKQLKVVVSGEQAADPPWPYRRIHLLFQATAASSLERIERAIDLSLNKYCSVRASLSPDVVVTFAAELLSDAPAEQ